MSILDTKKLYKKTLIIYLLFSAFCLLFNFIYSIFAKGISSKYMSFAFTFPLVLGALIYFIFYLKPVYNRISYNLYNASVATITLGSIVQGAIDISGLQTDTFIKYIYIYCVLVVISIIVQGIFFMINKNKKYLS